MQNQFWHIVISILKCSSSSSSNFIPNRIQQYNRVCMTNITNNRVIIDIVMWFCWWPPEKPWAYQAGSHSEIIIWIENFSWKKMHGKMLCVKCWLLRVQCVLYNEYFNKTGKFWEKRSISCVTRASATMLLTVWDRLVLVMYEERYQLFPFLWVDKWYRWVRARKT